MEKWDKRKREVEKERKKKKRSAKAKRRRKKIRKSEKKEGNILDVVSYPDTNEVHWLCKAHLIKINLKERERI